MAANFFKMPPPCGVESHASKEWLPTSSRCTPLRGGVSRWLLAKNGCQLLEDATPLRGGVSRWLLLELVVCGQREHPTGQARGIHGSVVRCLSSSKREPPRGKPVASREALSDALVATSVSLHGASPWHLGKRCRILEEQQT